MKSKKGTTLVEVIVAVAILAMIGVAVMDAFTTSSKVNRSAKVVDNATIVASNIIQNFKKEPEKFIKDSGLSPIKVDKKDEEGKNIVTAYKGTKNYDYIWKEASSEVENGYTLEYEITENKNIGSSAMYNPNSTISDDKFSLKGDQTDYLIYVVDTPTYGNWNKNGDYLVIFFKGWDKESYKTWIEGNEHDTTKPRVSYKAWFGWWGDLNGRYNYDGYKSMPSRYYNYYAMTDLIFGKCDTDRPATERLFYMKSDEYPSQYLYKSQCDNGAISIKIKEGDMDIKKNYNIQIVNDSTLDVNLYVAANDEEKVEEMNKKINIDLVSGVATRTVVNERKTYQCNYDMKVNVIRNSDKKIIHTISSKEYLAR